MLRPHDAAYPLRFARPAFVLAVCPLRGLFMLQALKQITQLIWRDLSVTFIPYVRNAYGVARCRQVQLDGERWNSFSLIRLK